MALVGLGAPDLRGVREEALRVERQEPGDLPALAVEVPEEFPGDIHHAQAAVVERHIHHIVLDPDVVAAGFRHLVAADQARRLLEVLVPFQDVDPAAPAGGLVLVARRAGADFGHRAVPPGTGRFVTGEDVELAGGDAAVGIDRVVPAGRERELPDEHRRLRRSALAAPADIHHRHAVAPVGGIGDALHHPYIVDGAGRVVEGETADPVRNRRVLDVDDVEPAPAGERVHMAVVDEGVVDAPGQSVVVFRETAHADRGVGHIEDHQAVPPVGRAFA